MGQVTVSARAPFPPERFVAALTEFGPDRSKIFPGSSPSTYTVHEVGDHWADVTEGTASAGIWQRYRYDWSQPGVVTLEVLDSNTFGPGSRWQYRVDPLPGDKAQIRLTIKRVPTTTKGRVTDPLLTVFGKPWFGLGLRRTVRRIARADALTERC